MTIPARAATVPGFDGAFLHADIDALDAIEGWIESRYGVEVAPWETALKRLSVMDRGLLSLVLERCLKGAEPKAVTDAIVLSDIADLASDAICLALYGRNTADELAHRQAAAERMAQEARNAE